MINVSSAWHRALLNDNRAYKEYITITLTDNTVLNLTEANIWQGGFQIEDAVSDESSFQFGAAIVNKLSLTINNIYDTYSEYVFDDAHVDVQIGLVTDSSTEIIDKGKFIVNTATYNGSLINLECYDYMTKFDKPYSVSQLVYPATLDEIVRDACTNCGMVLGTLNFPHKNFEIDTRPEDAQITFREMISWCAQVAGCFARVAVDGKLEIKWYNQTALENVMDGTDGGVFDNSTPYSTGDSVNGGTFNPWNTGDVVDGGAFTDSSGVHFISSLYSKDISVDDVVITGVSIEIKTEDNGNPVVTHLGGTSGYVVAISDNPLITTTNYSSILTWLQNQLVGFKFRKASISHGSDPSIEAGDVAMVFDANGNQYPIVVSKTTFSVGSSQNTVSAAQTPARNSAARYSAETKNYVELRKKVEAEKSAREISEAAIREELAAGSGLYYTAVPDTLDPTSTIYYLHNKTLLADSAIRIKFSTAGISVTADGTSQTPSWYGLTVNGDMLLNLLSATGINADWINTGSLDVGGLGNTNGSIRIYNIQGTQIGSWNKDGISVLDGTIGGWSIQPDGIRRSDATTGIGVGMLPGTNSAGTFLYVSDSSSGTTVYPFAVFSSGRVNMSNAHISGGTIAGWDITSSGITNTPDLQSKVAVLNGTGTSGVFLYVADTSTSTTAYPFIVYKDGRLIARALTATNTVKVTGSLGSFVEVRTQADTYTNPDRTRIDQNGFSIKRSDGEIKVSSDGSDPFGFVISYGSLFPYSNPAAKYTELEMLLQDYLGAKTSIQAGRIELSKNGTTFYKVTSSEWYLGTNLTVSGKKPRLVNTKDYAERYLYCYETPSPMFGDVGDAVIGEDGMCYVTIDPVFAETVTLSQYQVFLQRYGQGDCYVAERKGSYFVVEGTPGLEFGWELKAKQADFDQTRLDRRIEQPDLENKTDYSAESESHIHSMTRNYAQEAIDHINHIYEEREIA